jgi:serine beta-lactamase-like protein LACTB, mitochondrial
VSRRWNRTETWLALMVMAVGLLLVAIAGVFVYNSATATTLHPAGQAVPSEAHAAPPARWTSAAASGREIVSAALREQNLPGLSVAVGVGGEIVWAEGFGWANLEKRVPVTPDTRFRIGTASTALTSAAVGLLLERSQLALDDEIRTHVPAFPEKPWPVTLRQVMGHVAGVRSDGGDEGPLLSASCERPVDALQYFADRPLLFEPGTEYRFSRYGWILVSAVIEAVADQPFVRFMRKEIFEPLGMHDTRADSPMEPMAERATPYFPRFAADPRYGPDPMRAVDYSCYAGASVFLSTPSDLVRFGMAIESATLLQPATVQLLQTSQRLTTGAETGYGLGWDQETVTLAGEQTRAVGHDGDSLGGMVASLATFHDRGLVVAVISNISYADTFGLAVRIADVFAREAGAPARK